MFGFGGGGFGSRIFQDSFRCHSVGLLAAEQQRDPARLEYSDKLILPQSCLEKLARLEISYPMMFAITNPRYTQRTLHCGVLEFVAPEGMVYLPYWMMENMHLSEGDLIHLRSATIPKGVFVKLQPQNTDFIKISNPKAVLEQSLRNFSALSKGQTFRIQFNKRKYDIGVVEVRGETPFAPGAPDAICIIEADVQVDFEAPADYVEPPKDYGKGRPSPPSASPLSASPLAKSPLLQSLGDPNLEGDSSDDEDAKPKAFTGSGFRLDGKKLKTPSKTPSKGNTLGSSSGDGAVRVGVRISANGELGSGQTLGGALGSGGRQAPGSGQALGGGAGGSAAGGQTLGGGSASMDTSGGGAGEEDYWAKLSGGNKLR